MAIQYNDYDIEWAEGFDEILTNLGGTPPDNDEVFEYMCETKDDIAANVYYQLVLSRIESDIEEKYPDAEVSYYVNARDTKLYINGEQVYNWGDAQPLLTSLEIQVPFGTYTYEESDDPDAKMEDLNEAEVKEFIIDHNRDFEVNYKSVDEFNEGEEYREFTNTEFEKGGKIEIGQRVSVFSSLLDGKGGGYGTITNVDSEGVDITMDDGSEKSYNKDFVSELGSPYGSPFKILDRRTKEGRKKMAKGGSVRKFNLLSKRKGVNGGKWSIANKKPMTSKEADEMYDDFKRSGLYNDDSNPWGDNLSVEEIREELPFAKGGMVNKIIGIARTQADSTDTETYIYPISADVPPKFYNEVGFKLENKNDIVRIIEMYFDTKEIVLQGYDNEGENYEDIKVYKLDDLSEDFQKWIVKNLIMKSRREKGKTRYAKGGEVNEVYVDYMNKKKGFRPDRKYFKTYEEAEKWGRKEFERFNSDMIGYTEFERPLNAFAKGGKIVDNEGTSLFKGDKVVLITDDEEFLNPEDGIGNTAERGDAFEVIRHLGESDGYDDDSNSIQMKHIKTGEVSEFYGFRVLKVNPQYEKGGTLQPKDEGVAALFRNSRENEDNSLPMISVMVGGKWKNVATDDVQAIYNVDGKGDDFEYYVNLEGVDVIEKGEDYEFTMANEEAQNKAYPKRITMFRIYRDDYLAKGGELDDIVRKLDKVRNEFVDLKLKADLDTEEGVAEFRKKAQPLKKQERKLEDKLEEMGEGAYTLPFAKGGMVDYDEVKEEVLDKYGYTIQDFNKGDMNRHEAQKIMKETNEVYMKRAKPQYKDLGMRKFAKGGMMPYDEYADSLSDYSELDGKRVYNEYTERYGYVNDDEVRDGRRSGMANMVWVSGSRDTDRGTNWNTSDTLIIEDKDYAKGGEVSKYKTGITKYGKNQYAVRVDIGDKNLIPKLLYDRWDSKSEAEAFAKRLAKRNNGTYVGEDGMFAKGGLVVGDYVNIVSDNEIYDDYRKERELMIESISDDGDGETMYEIEDVPFSFYEYELEKIYAKGGVPYSKRFFDIVEYSKDGTIVRKIENKNTYEAEDIAFKLNNTNPVRSGYHYVKMEERFAKGGEVKKKGNEMIIGGLAGVLLGIFLNK